jgi:hypothetical protein
MASHHNDTDLGNVAGSSAIGVFVTFLIEQVLPWTIHTLSGVLTAVIVAFCVYKFNKWLKRNDK